MTHKISKKLLNVLVPVLIVVAMVTTYKVMADKNPINKAEMAYVEHSPIGARGGSVMPASCDSYPSHSTCECNPTTSPPETYDNPPTTTSCSFANGVGRLVRHCQGGESWTWVRDSCVLVSCNTGFDRVSDSAGIRCQANCTGNNYRTYTTDTVVGCSCWSNQTCATAKNEDSKRYSKYLGIESAFAAYCVDPIYGSTASCSACPNGTIPNANHTACVAPAVPSININLGL